MAGMGRTHQCRGGDNILAYSRVDYGLRQCNALLCAMPSTYG